VHGVKGRICYAQISIKISRTGELVIVNQPRRTSGCPCRFIAVWLWAKLGLRFSSRRQIRDEAAVPKVKSGSSLGLNKRRRGAMTLRAQNKCREEEESLLRSILQEDSTRRVRYFEEIPNNRSKL